MPALCLLNLESKLPVSFFDFGADLVDSWAEGALLVLLAQVSPLLAVRNADQAMLVIDKSIRYGVELSNQFVDSPQALDFVFRFLKLARLVITCVVVEFWQVLSLVQRLDVLAEFFDFLNKLVY